MKRISYFRSIGGALVMCSLVLAGCGNADDADEATSTVPDSPDTTVAPPGDTSAATTPATKTSATTTPATDPPATTSTQVESAASKLNDDELAAQVEALLADAIAPGSIRWDGSGVDVPASAAVAAVRAPGRDDVLVAAGENVDGSPAEADAPFFAGTLTESLLRTVAVQLVDDGVLDATATVDRWAPTVPNADRVTVQMLIDDTTGWSDDPPLDPDPVVTDLSRAWSLREVVDMRAKTITALAEPGAQTANGVVNETLLGLIVEDVTGQPLAQVVEERITSPAGLDDTELAEAGFVAPERWRNGLLAFGGSKLDTSAFDPTSYVTFNQATISAVSTPTDLLDLLDAWATGELFTTARTPAPDRYEPEPALNAAFPAAYYHVGRGVPWNGFCPCTTVDDGIEPTAWGRSPSGVGSRTWMLRYPDGISVVVNVNSNEADPTDIRTVADDVHDVTAAAG